ncbi:hypothetical protein F0562_022875 [Nyssa sinensis]|uniref:Protein kinase domain-containing protein n=1 Tax=Nyssa sinensis TaxID=561372 RepID=A0A5J5BF04_9ASTE|nr:hypothetical protein F0562_022875 [Nyssa sinensis]
MGFLYVLLGGFALIALVNAQDQSGFISIDCGISEDFSYKDETTNIYYTSDAQYIDTGVNMNISPEYNSTTLQQQYANVRSFPQGIKNCYTLRPAQGKDNKYLIRALFMYGNYDALDKVPEFYLYLGVNLWDSVALNNASDVVMKEIIHTPSTNYIYVCLVNSGFGVPFISALELRPLNNSIYKTQSGSLGLFARYDMGSTIDQTIRYGNDVYDRIWSPYNFAKWDSISTKFSNDSFSDNNYKPPSIVMETAVRPSNASGSVDFYWSPADSNSQFYVYMHFAEVEKLQVNQTREFNVSVNGELWYGPLVPDYLSITTVYSQSPLSGSEISFSIYKTAKSTLPPIINALEIYMVKQLLQSPTNQEDGMFQSVFAFFDAIMKIKSLYGLTKNWQGDPCAPRISLWDGLNCSYSGFSSPQIISLNLSSSGLTGEIAPSISNLTSLEDLDLSNNSLTGQLPEFLAEMPFLKTLNLTGNNFSGSIPSLLVEKSKNVAVLVESNGYNEPRDTNEDVQAYGPNKGKGVLVHYAYDELRNITRNFERVIGKGGFGTVYHGYLKNGTQVAVKMLLPSAHASKQFQTEVELLMTVRHKNLVSFIGYCDEGPNMGLVCEYMANGNLQELLSGKLSWKQRLQVAIDAAQGLDYLHSGCRPPIIHRDVKTSNILLSENLQAKMADFGFSRIFPAEDATHVSTRVVGTPGYLDPEYYQTQQLNEKSDVYSFGIVLLELITGQAAIVRSNVNTHIVQWVSPMLEGGDIQNIVDPRLEGDFHLNSVWKTTEIAMACVDPASIQRPTMSCVVTELKECLAMGITGRTHGKIKEENEDSIEMNVMGPSAR